MMKETMQADTVSMGQLFLRPEHYVGRKVVVKGMLQATVDGVFLSQPGETRIIKLNITANDLARADKKGWVLVGGGKLYNYESLVTAIFSYAGDPPSSFALLEIDAICLLQADTVNQINLREVPGGAPPSIVEI